MKIKKLLAALTCSLLLVSSVAVAACNSRKTLYKIDTEFDAAMGSITLTPSEDEGGYAKGEEVTATVKANSGYEVETVTVNEAEVTLTAEGTYTFEVEQDTAIKAVFTAEGEDGPTIAAGYIGTWVYPDPIPGMADVSLVVTEDGFTLKNGEENTAAAENIEAAGGGYTCTMTAPSSDGTSVTENVTLELLSGGNVMHISLTVADAASNQPTIHMYFTKKDATLPDLKLPAGFEGNWTSNSMELTVAADGSVTSGQKKVTILTLGEETEGKRTATGLIENVWFELGLTADAITVKSPGLSDATLTKEQAGSDLFGTGYVGSWGIFYEKPLAVNRPYTVWHLLAIEITADGLTVKEATPSTPDEILYTVSDLAADPDGGYTFKVQGGGTAWDAHIELTAEDNALKAVGTPAEGDATTAIFVKDGLNQVFLPSSLTATKDWETADKENKIVVGEDGDFFLNEDPIWFLTAADDGSGTYALTGLWRTDYLTGTMSATAISLTVGGSTLTFAPKAKDPITFPGDYQDEWTEIGEGTDTISIERTSFTYNDEAYDVTEVTDAPVFGGNAYSFTTKDGKKHYFAIGADGHILQMFTEGSEGEWKIFEGWMLPDLALKDFEISFANRSYVGDDMPTVTFDNGGKMKIGGDAAQIIYNDVAEAQTFYLLWAGTYYTVTVAEKGASLTFTDLYGNAITFTAGFAEASKGTWHLVGTTVASMNYSLTVNATTVTLNGKTSGAVSYSDEYGTDNAYYAFKTDFNYILYFLGADTAVVRSGSNFMLYSKSATPAAAVFPEEYRDRTWTSETSTLGNIVIDKDGNASIGGAELKIIAVVETSTTNLFGRVTVTTTVHILYNNNYYAITLGTKSFTMTNQGQSTQSFEYEPLVPGPITDVDDLNSYKGTWKIFGAGDAATDTVVIGADGKFTYKGTEYGLLPAAEEGGYTFDITTGTGEDATTTTYTIGLCYGGDLLFVAHDDDGFAAYEYFIKDGKQLANDGKIPAAYNGEYTNENGYTLTIADGTMTLKMEQETIGYYLTGVEASSDVGGHIACAYLNGWGYADIFFTATAVEIHAHIGDLILTKSGGSQGGGQTTGVTLPSWFAGTWTQMNAPDAQKDVLTLKAGDTSVTINIPDNGKIACTLTKADENSFTMECMGVEIVAVTLETNTDILKVDLLGHICYYLLGDEYNELFALADYQSSSWTSAAGGTLAIDATGKITWTKKGASAGADFHIFSREENKIVCYALFGTDNECYKITFGTDEIKIESTDYNTESGQPYETYTFTKQA